MIDATFDAEWARCSPWLEAALASLPARTHGLDDVRSEVASGNARFWPGENSAAVTQIETYPLLSALSIWLGGGDLTELRDQTLPQIEAYAIAHGCRFVAITGRPGWSRELGYSPLHRTCVKELT